MIPRSILRILGLALLLNSNLPAAESATAGEPSAPDASAKTAASALPALPEVAGKVDYILRPSDTLQVRIFQEEDLTREISISQEYTVSLPLIGTINLKGKSVRQAEDTIRQLYDKDFLVNPQVTVTVLRYAERTVNVIGAVNSPQAVSFPIEQGLTLIEAITRAGGFSRVGNQKDVRITRTDEQGVTKTFSVNTVRLRDGQSSNLWSLQVGDVVFVPESTF